MHLLRRYAPLVALAVLVTATSCKSDAKAAGTKPLATFSTPPASTGYHGVIDSVIKTRPEFLLTDTQGRAFDFTAKTGGKPTLLYFGYTNCPDECPTTLHDLHTALKLVPAAVRDKIIVVFVTTDPKRDTPLVLSRYLQSFDSTFIGLTGSASQVAAAETAVGVPLAAADPKAPLPNGGYSVSHAAVLVAYDTADRNPVLYPSGTSVETYAADLPLLAKEH